MAVQAELWAGVQRLGSFPGAPVGAVPADRFRPGVADHVLAVAEPAGRRRCERPGQRRPTGVLSAARRPAVAGGPPRCTRLAAGTGPPRLAGLMGSCGPSGAAVD